MKPLWGPRAATPLLHPAWLRLCHWINAGAVVGMAASGWRIYDAAPFFDFAFPKSITIGGWLGGALQWHFALMWILVLNGAVYAVCGLLSGRFRSKLLPLSIAELIRDGRLAVTLRLRHDDLGTYNALQRFAYVSVLVDLVVIVLSGLVLWKSVQFPLLRELLGGYESARRWHFASMSFLCAFGVGHLFMVALVPRSLVAMIRGHE